MQDISIARRMKTLHLKYDSKDAESHKMEFDYQIDADIFQQKTDLANSLDNYFEVNKKEPLFTNKFQYLNAQRIEPRAENKASYSSVVLNNDIGKYGQFTAHYIELRGNEYVEFDNILHKDSTTKDTVTGKSFTNKTLINQINLWMGEVSPDVNIRTTKVTSELVLLEYVFIQPNFGNTNRYKPENVGFGISYALHVVVALLKAKKVIWL
jgi:predicted ATPase